MKLIAALQWPRFFYRTCFLGRAMETILFSKIFGIGPLILVQGYGCIVLLMSFFTFFVYGWDKRSAEKGTNRVPEKSLHLLELLGGWPGAIAGQQFFRHKTQKTLFWALTYLIATAHVVAFGTTLWFAWS